MQASVSFRASSAMCDEESQNRITVTRAVTTATSVTGLTSEVKLMGMASRDRLRCVLAPNPAHRRAGDDDRIGDQADNRVDFLGRDHETECAGHPGKPGDKRPDHALRLPPRLRGGGLLDLAQFGKIQCF